MNFRGNGMSAYRDAVALNARRSDVEAVAEEIAAELGYSYDGNLDRIVERLEGKIEVLPSQVFSEAQDASILIEQDGQFVIRLPAHTPPTRDRFSIAHELGHLFLHFDPEDGPMQAYRKESEPVEWEANWFASAFLMPEHEFKRTYKETGESLLQTAKRFGVSEAAARIRAKRLGLIVD
jgi:Zn-dependent peptidase ImmA (M78 family)